MLKKAGCAGQAVDRWSDKQIKIIFGLDFAGSDEYRKRELVQAASGHDRHCGKLHN